MKKIVKKNQIIITALAIMIAAAGYLNYSGAKFGFGSSEKDSEDKAASVSESGEESASLDNVLRDIESMDTDITDQTVETAQNTDAEDAAAESSGAAAGEDADTTGSRGTADTTGSTGAAANTTGSTGAAADTTGSADAVDGTAVPGEAVLTGATGYIAQAKISREQMRSENKEALMDVINNTSLSEQERQGAVSSMVSITDIAEKETAAEMMLETKGFSDAVVSLSGENADVVVPFAQLSQEQLAQIEDVVKRKTGIAPENIVISPGSEGK